MIIHAASLHIDLSRSPLSQTLIDQFADNCDQAQLAEKKHALFNGEKINTTEDRAAHHTALRDPLGEHPHSRHARESLNKVIKIADEIRSGQWLGATGKPIKTVINIGIGGSDLGPRMATAALQKVDIDPKVHYIANIDPAEMEVVLAQSDPATTLFIVASKSFRTLETLENGLAARRWLLESIEESQINKHVIAVTSNIDRAIEYGVHPENILPMWDWVGGRYSLWSTIGLPIAIAIGSAAYQELLNGAHAMDQHFLTSDLSLNAPTLLALLENHYIKNFGMQSLAVLPYSHRLSLLPDYLQQLCMESNGKRVTHAGVPVDQSTCPILWGSAGTVGQHSFYQLLHQGTQSFAADFILPLRSSAPSDKCDDRHLHLIANCLAQRDALSKGKSYEKALEEVAALDMDEAAKVVLARHKEIPGKKPSTLITMKSLNAFSLGALLALYEHKTFVQSVIWDINAFDQWGVELGKQLSDPIFSALIDGERKVDDPNTQHWIDQVRTATLS